jgi:hypothetical protein
MTDNPDCECCQRIGSVIEQGLSSQAAREENGRILRQDRLNAGNTGQAWSA